MAASRIATTNAISAEISAWYRGNHERLLALTEELSDDQLAWQPHPSSTSIAFNLWHGARWADRLQEVIPDFTPELSQLLGSSPQIWNEEDPGAAWGLDRATLGYLETGMEMSNEAAALLRLPNKQTVLAYARRTFAAAQRAVGAIRDEQLPMQIQSSYRFRSAPMGPAPTISEVVMLYLTHDSEHLGMIEYLRGLQSLQEHGDT